MKLNTRKTNNSIKGGKSTTFKAIKQ